MGVLAHVHCQGGQGDEDSSGGVCLTLPLVYALNRSWVRSMASVSFVHAHEREEGETAQRGEEG